MRASHRASESPGEEEEEQKLVAVPGRTPIISSEALGTQWEAKVRKHEDYHVAQFNGLKTPDLSTYHKADATTLAIFQNTFWGWRESTTATIDMDDATIQAKVEAEAKALVEAERDSMNGLENARFLNDWITNMVKREQMERPAYTETQNEEPVYFLHPSLEPWKTWDIW